MQIWRIVSGRSSSWALKFSPFGSSITFEISVKHSHRTETESLYSFETFSSEVERIAGITDKDITAKNTSIAIARFPEEMSGTEGWVKGDYVALNANAERTQQERENRRKSLPTRGVVPIIRIGNRTGNKLNLELR